MVVQRARYRGEQCAIWVSASFHVEVMTFADAMMALACTGARGDVALAGWSMGFALRPPTETLSP
jgi:hypothetical protein